MAPAAARLAALAATLLLGAAGLARGEHKLPAYRLVQYDMDGAAGGGEFSGGEPVPRGSRTTVFSQHMTLPTGGQGLHRAAVVIPADAQLTPDQINELLDSEAAVVGGLVFVLPRDFDAGPDGPLSGGGDDATLARWAALEEALAGRKVSVPVYFVFADDELDAAVADIDARIRSGNPPKGISAGYKLSVSGARGTPKKLGGKVKLSNLHGTLTGGGGGVAAGETPTILVTAAYDSMAAAPGLASGAASATAAAGLLELLRMFARLYEEASTRGAYDLIFLLHAGARFNKAGVAHWLAMADPRLLETVDFALCLDGLGAWGAPGTGLSLHVSRLPKDPQVASLYDSFEAAAGRLGVPLRVNHRKVDLQAEAVRWEHERFAKHRVLAATLSDATEPPQGLAGLADRAHRVNTTSLAAAVRLAGDVLAERVYNRTGLFEGGGGPGVSAPHLGAWLGHLGATPRASPFLAEKDSALVGALQRALGEQVKAKDVGVQPFTLEHADVFYGEPTATLTLFRTASALLDVYVFLGALAYLGGLYAALAVATKGWDDFVDQLRAEPKKAR
mmetsp:Transcript_20683/g.70335  ORF Transcript_20683/g.70335 Transcript_20683/m.70335 type:complete len:562 (-) Transcript_20683:66-1751(-)